MTKYILTAIIIIMFSIPAHTEQRDVGLSFKLNKSLGLVPFGNIRLDEDSDKDLKLINGTFGFAFDLLYKSKRRAYFNLTLDYNSLLVNDDFRDLNGKEFSGYFVKIGFNGISYMDAPDVFTPYIGYGVGIIFVNTNQDDLLTFDADEYEEIKGDLISEFTLSFDIKGGLLVPVNENFSITADLDLGVYFSNYLGLIPRIQIGGVYWLE